MVKGYIRCHRSGRSMSMVGSLTRETPRIHNTMTAASLKDIDYCQSRTLSLFSHPELASCAQDSHCHWIAIVR